MVVETFEVVVGRFMFWNLRVFKSIMIIIMIWNLYSAKTINNIQKRFT